jgi:hypothetical protein
LEQRYALLRCARHQKFHFITTEAQSSLLKTFHWMHAVAQAAYIGAAVSYGSKLFAPVA